VFAPAQEPTRRRAEYARKAKKAFGKLKEEAIRPIFFSAILDKISAIDGRPGSRLYARLRAADRRGKVDVALGRFDDAQGVNEIVAPFEFKGPGVRRSDAHAGAGRSPVQQAGLCDERAPARASLLV